MGWQGFLYMEWAGGVVLGGELERWEICGGMAEPPRVLGKAHIGQRREGPGPLGILSYSPGTVTLARVQAWQVLYFSVGATVSQALS